MVVYNQHTAFTVMPDHYNDFVAQKNKMRGIAEDLFNQHHSRTYGVLQDALRLQTDMLGLRPLKGHTLDNKLMCYNMCVYNVHSLYTANDLLKSDSFHILYAILRVVFESFPKIFYCMTHKERAKHMYCCEAFFYHKNTAHVSNEKPEYCKSAKNINDEKCRYVKNPRWFRERVYTDARRRKLTRQYSIYSIASHPSIVQFHAIGLDAIKESMATGLDIMTSYSLMNLFIMVNVAADELKAHSKLDDSIRLVKDLMQKVRSDLGNTILHLYPDKDEYTKGLPFVLPISE